MSHECPFGINRITFCGQNTILAADSGGRLTLFEFDTKIQQVQQYKSALGNGRSHVTINDFDIHDNNYVITVDSNGNAKTIDLVKNKTINEHHCSSCIIWSVKIIDSTLRFLAGNSYGQVCLCDPSTKESCTKSFRLFFLWSTYRANNFSAVRALAVNPLDSSVFLAGYSDGNLQVWDIRKETSPVSKLGIHTSDIYSILFHPEDPTLVFTCSQDSTIKSLHPGSSVSTKVSFANTSCQNRWSKINAFEHELTTKTLVEPDFLSINSIAVSGNTLLAGTDACYLLQMPHLS